MSWVLGIDEVGRGSLAGPVYLSGVLVDSYPIFTFKNPENKDNFGNLLEYKHVRDSKKLTKIQREKTYNVIINNKIPYQTVSANSDLIDHFGIGVCLSHLLAILISEILEKYNPVNPKIIVDGKIKLLASLNSELVDFIKTENSIKNLNIVSLAQVEINPFDQKKFELLRENKADDNYLSVALASNLAKVQRDSYMDQLSQLYPQYNWAQNKGYGTQKHLQAIRNNPNNQYLRQSFLGNVYKDISHKI